MIIERVIIQGFMRFGSAQTLEFRSGLNLIEGDNGAGKSSILDAIVWCLFGKTMRGLTGDSVINRDVGKNCFVQLGGETDRGDEWILVRGKKYRSKPNYLDFAINGKSLAAQGEPRETQRIINQTLGVDYDVFVNSTVFGQGVKWRFTELTDAQRKSVLDKFLGFEKLNAALDYVKERAASMLREWGDAKKGLDTIDTQIESTRENIQTAKDTWETQVRERLEETREELRDVRDQIKKLSLPPASASHDLKLLQSKLKVQTEVVTKMRDQFAEAQSERADSAARARAAWKLVTDAKEKYEKQAELKTGKCPECGSKITAANRKKHLKETKAALDKLNIEHDTIDYEAQGWDRKYSRLQKELPVIEKHTHELTAKIVTAQQEEAVAKESKRRLSDLKKRRTKLKSELETRKDSLQQPPTEKYKKKLVALKRDRKNMAVTVERWADKAKLYEFWVDGFGNTGIKSHLLDHVVPVLNSKLADYARQLAPKTHIEFDSQSVTKKGEARDKIDVSVTIDDGADQYQGNSVGERRKVDIIIARALQSLNERNSSMAFWDEVFESLDSTSCEDVMTMLRTEAQDKSVFVISHQEWLKAYFPSILTVTKEKGFSILEWS